MTVDDMVHYFEREGFDTTGEYWPFERIHKFTIAKDAFNKKFTSPKAESSHHKENYVSAFDFAFINDFNKKPNTKKGNPMKIKHVHFSGPCTVVIWEDGTKTMVRANNEDFDPEKGLAMAIAKKALGTNKNRSNYYDEFKKWVDPYLKEKEKKTGEVEVPEK